MTRKQKEAFAKAMIAKPKWAAEYVRLNKAKAMLNELVTIERAEWIDVQPTARGGRPTRKIRLLPVKHSKEPLYDNNNQVRVKRRIRNQAELDALLRGQVLSPGRVDLATKKVHFTGCDDREAMVGAAGDRLALINSQLNARSGSTNRERRMLNREANILRRWLWPDYKPPAKQRSERNRFLNGFRNRRRSRKLTKWGWPKPTKRECREARRTYREEHTQWKRPDWSQPVVCSEEERARLLRKGNTIQKKRAWFKRKHALAA